MSMRLASAELDGERNETALLLQECEEPADEKRGRRKRSQRPIAVGFLRLRIRTANIGYRRVAGAYLRTNP